jgi:thiol-disulfide isomerase/thioredoxin
MSMTSLFNQYSVLWISPLILLGLFVVLRLRRAAWRVSLVVMLLAVVVLAAGYLALRPGNSDVDSFTEAAATIANGRPTFLEFFSNYCVGCLASRPAVDTIVADIQGDFNILRVDIHSDFGRILRENLTFSFTPEFVLFNTSGEEIWRSHVPPSQEQLALATG